MERIDHIHIIKVCRGGLVGYVDWMLQRKVPDGERFELGVAGRDPFFVLVVELAQADSHLSAARSWSRHDDKWARGLDIVVSPVALLGINQSHVIRIAFYRVVVIGLDTHFLELGLVRLGAGLAVEVRDHNAADKEASVLKFSAKA